MKEKLLQANNRAVRRITVLSVLLFLLAGAASLYLATLRASANNDLRRLDEQRVNLSKEDNAIRAEIGEITAQKDMEQRARLKGYVPATPALYLTATPRP